MALPAQRFRAIEGGRSRARTAHWYYRPPMSRLQRYLAGRPENRNWTHGTVPRLLGLRKIWAWLTRPSEFVQLREADAVVRLLTPQVPIRCSMCGRFDWFIGDLCTMCEERVIVWPVRRSIW